MKVLPLVQKVLHTHLQRYVERRCFVTTFHILHGEKYIPRLFTSECTVYTHLDRIYCQVLFKNTFSCFWSFIYYCFIFFIEKKYLKHQLRGLHVHCALYWFVFHCNNKLILFLNCVCVCVFFSLVKFLLIIKFISMD